MILSAVFGFISGIAFGSFLHFPIWLYLTILLSNSLIFLYSKILKGREKFYVTIASVFIFGLVLGIIRISFSDLYQTSKLNNFENQKVLVVGVVDAEPDQREDNTKLTVRTEKIILDGREFSVNEDVLLTAPIYPNFNYGDEIKFETNLKRPQNFSTNDDGRVFDYVGYLRAKGIWFTAKVFKVDLVSENKGNFVVAGLFKIKNAFENSISNSLEEPYSSLMNGILLGAKQSLGKDILSEFQKTGTSHVVVLSGYNIAIVANSVMSFLSFLPKNISFGFGVTSIILFTILSGSGASANRAAIMVVTALFAKRFNRDYKANRALGFAVLLMLAPNPLLLIYDPSFQLSVLATIGLVYVTPIVSPYFSFVTERFGLREILSSTISAQVTTLPLLVYTTGIVSIVSLPVNILVLGVVPTTMFLGFIMGLFGLVSYYLAFIPAFFAKALLWWILTVIHVGSNLPFAYIKLPIFSLGVLAGVYLGILSSLYFVKKKIT